MENIVIEETTPTSPNPNGDTNLYLIEEYKEAGALHRLLFTLIFGQITVYLATSGAILNAIANTVPPLENQPKVFLSILGLIITGVFFIITDRAGYFSYAARERAKQLESVLGFNLYSKKLDNEIKTDPKSNSTKLTAINATKTLYAVGVLVWLYSLLEIVL